MTNQPDQDRIEGAKLIVEFMPDWRMNEEEYAYFHTDYLAEDGHRIGKPIETLWQSHDLLHEVLTEIYNRLGESGMRKYHGNLINTIDDYCEGQNWKTELADSEDKFDAIVACLEGEVE